MWNETKEKEITPKMIKTGMDLNFLFEGIKYIHDSYAIFCKSKAGTQFKWGSQAKQASNELEGHFETDPLDVVLGLNINWWSTFEMGYNIFVAIDRQLPSSDGTEILQKRERRGKYR